MWYSFFSKKDCTQEFLKFIRTEQRPSIFLTSAGNQPFCRKHIIFIGCYHGFTICPRKITERNIAIKMHKNHFFLIWETQGVIFNKAIEELEKNFKIVENSISDKHVKSYIKYEYKRKKVPSQLTNMDVYDLETFNLDGIVPYANCVYRLGKVSGKYNRDMTLRQYEKRRKDCINFKGTDSVNGTLDHVLKFKGEA